MAIFSNKVLCGSVLTEDMGDRMENGLHTPPLLSGCERAGDELTKGETDAKGSSSLMSSNGFPASWPRFYCPRLARCK